MTVVSTSCSVDTLLMLGMNTAPAETMPETMDLSHSGSSAHVAPRAAKNATIVVAITAGRETLPNEPANSVAAATNAETIAFANGSSLLVDFVSCACQAWRVLTLEWAQNELFGVAAQR